MRDGAMAAADGASGGAVSAGQAVGGGVLRRAAQRPHPLQRPQPRQSRGCSQGALSDLMPNRIGERVTLNFTDAQQIWGRK
jgi:hypothetical protein